MFEDAIAGQNDDTQDDEEIQVTQKRKLHDKSKLRRPSYYSEECNIACSAVIIDEPQIFKKAMADDNAEK